MKRHVGSQVAYENTTSTQQVLYNDKLLNFNFY